MDDGNFGEWRSKINPKDWKKTALDLPEEMKSFEALLAELYTRRTGNKYDLNKFPVYEIGEMAKMAQEKKFLEKNFGAELAVDMLRIVNWLDYEIRHRDDSKTQDLESQIDLYVNLIRERAQAKHYFKPPGPSMSSEDFTKIIASQKPKQASGIEDGSLFTPPDKVSKAGEIELEREKAKAANIHL